MIEESAPKSKFQQTRDRLDCYWKHRNTLPIIMLIITTILAISVLYIFISDLTFNISKDHAKLYPVEILPYAESQEIKDGEGNSPEIYYYNDSMDNLLCNLHKEGASGRISI